jgi:predicted amidophosphoribosyltransferase
MKLHPSVTRARVVATAYKIGRPQGICAACGADVPDIASYEARKKRCPDCGKRAVHAAEQYFYMGVLPA